MANIFQKTLAAFGVRQKGALQLGGGRGSRSWFYGLLPGAQVDYQKLAGDLWKNSIVAASINWIGRNLPQAPPCVYALTKDGEKIVPGHPLTALLTRPNKYYSGRTLRWGTMLSLIVSGNAYWYIVFSNDGKPKELWYLPHYLVTPVAGENTDDWITGYEYKMSGQTITLPFESVIHFRDGLDPNNLFQGISPLASAFRQVVTDNEAEGYAASILRNMGIPGAIISPKDSNKTFDQPEADELKAQYEESTQGDNRGRPMVLSGPVEVKTLALSPEELLMDTAQDKPEERICALIGIPPGVLQLGVGIKKSTFSNRESDHEAAWYEGIIPRLDLIHSELDTQLLPLMGTGKNERVGADYSKVRALQESLDSLYKRLTDAVGGPWMKPNEARSQVNLAELPEGDVLYPPKAGGGQPEPNEPDGADAADEDAGKDATEETETGDTDKSAKDKKSGKGKKSATRQIATEEDLSWAMRVQAEIDALDADA